MSRWFEAWQQDKPGWIRGAGRAGRRPKLDKAQCKQVDEALRQGAQAHGFGTDLWTLPRVAAVKHTFTEADVYARASRTLENCIKHGLEPRISGGTVTLRTRIDNGRLLLEIEDDGVGIEPGGPTTAPVSGLVREGSGIGMP